MNMVMRQIKLIISAFFAISPYTVIADPVIYDLTFDGSVWGDSGAGSFVWEPDTRTMTSLYVDFGLDKRGTAIDDDILALEIDDKNTNVGTWIYMIVTGDQLVTNFCCGYDSLGVGNAGDNPFFRSYNFLNLNYWNVSYFRDDTDLPFSYTFTLSNDTNGLAHWAGVYSIEVRSVPEPSTFALLGLGLAGIGMARRRNTA